MRVLITGCRGDIGRSLASICKRMRWVAIGVDANAGNGYQDALFESCHWVPRATDPEYFVKLYQRALCNQVDMIVPTTDWELREFLKDDLLPTMSGYPVIAANRKAIEIGLDKYKTNEMLVAAELPFPVTCPVFMRPAIAKPRFGQGGKGVLHINEPYIWQEYLDGDEYTCGLFAIENDVRTIVFKRELERSNGRSEGGHTSVAETADIPEINALLVNIAHAIELRGSVNVQLRLTKKGPMVFEINPRFSSTVEFRHVLGFEDFVWSLQDVRGQPISSYKPVHAGIRLMRDDVEVLPTWQQIKECVA